LIEAMKCRCPVIASKDPALVEVGGGAAVHCDVHDVPAWIAAIEHVMSNPEPMRDAGEQRAAQFSWGRTAKQTYEVYQEAMRRFGR
jgi:glycosyltransferase involved in cell wall biosynthesis